jgi:hypothetical protein
MPVWRMGIFWARLPTEGYANDCLDREIEIDPDCAYLYAERANFRQRMGDSQGAIVDYVREASLQENRAIDLQPHNQLFRQWRDRAN